MKLPFLCTVFLSAAAFFSAIAIPSTAFGAMSDQALSAYVGNYPPIPGFVLTIRVRNAQLEAQATGQGAFPLDYSGNDRFAAPAFGIEIRRNRDAEDRVESLTLYQGGQQLIGKWQ